MKCWDWLGIAYVGGSKRKKAVNENACPTGARLRMQEGRSEEQSRSGEMLTLSLPPHLHRSLL
jgi:hypothetical protein